ncbi:integrase arm-type DNA-binding domain-containing protein [Aquibium sp. LZ166]|uniref:Integrase arm-type DNA-binding domain-containing protein n=1 Tax=Aquibium pacificus TaxID=3153579 RepID=A0ABV3SMG2_9HYPH
MAVLSELELKNAKPRAERYDLKDGKVSGLWVRVTTNGVKSYVLKYRFEGRSLRLTIGHYPDISLAIARGKAEVARGKIAAGIDPQAVKKKERQKLADRVDGLVTQYIEDECKGPNFEKTGPLKASWKNIKTDLAHDKASLVQSCGTRSIHHVTDADIASILKKVTAKRGPQAANNALKRMKAFFDWCRKPPRRLIAVSPCEGMDKPTEDPSRERVVTDAELAAIWQGCDAIGYPYGYIVKLLMLTGQRRTEVAAMRWNELNLDAGNWEIPGDRTKNDEPTIIPLSTLALEILRSVPRLNEKFVFPARGNEESHFSGYSRSKLSLDRKALIDGKPLENWTQHDLRRTLATNLGRRQVLPHVIEHILNHKAASMSAVSKIYNRFQYLPEKREAAQLWCDHVAGLVKQTAKAALVA